MRLILPFLLSKSADNADGNIDNVDHVKSPPATAWQVALTGLFKRGEGSPISYFWLSTTLRRTVEYWLCVHFTVDFPDSPFFRINFVFYYPT